MRRNNTFTGDVGNLAKFPHVCTFNTVQTPTGRVGALDLGRQLVTQPVSILGFSIKTVDQDLLGAQLVRDGGSAVTLDAKLVRKQRFFYGRCYRRR